MNPPSSTKRIKTSSAVKSPTYVFRLARTLPRAAPFQPTTTTATTTTTTTTATPTATPIAPKPVSRGTIPIPAGFRSISDISASTGTKTDGDADLPPRADTPSRKRKINPVRKYQLAKRLRTKHPHPYSPRSAVFERVREPADGDDDDDDDDDDMRDLPPPAPVAERKKPRTHPKEKAALREARAKGVVGSGGSGGGGGSGGQGLTLGFEQDEKLMKEMEKMVLDYLNDERNDGIQNLPPTAPTRNPVGGGVGGGTWAGDGAAMGDEAEDGFVYDVYIREEVTADVVNEVQRGEGSYGVIVFEESDDEAWWYEGADEEAETSDVFASDDEDSNGS